MLGRCRPGVDDPQFGKSFAMVDQFCDRLISPAIEQADVVADFRSQDMQQVMSFGAIEFDCSLVDSGKL